MGLFYLLSLYCAIRGFSSAQNRRWYSLAILACALGMGTKEVMATAPFMVLLYDRIFVSRSFKKEVFTRRWGLHVGLAATWLIFGGLAFFAPRGESVGFDYPDLTGPQYAITQCKVIVSDYLKLSFWPHPLVLDYGWPIVKNFSYVVPHALVLVVLLVATLAALHYYPAWGFLGVWFFVILAPSSSIVPIITEVAAEHRMYLPLAAVVVAVVLGGYVILVGLVISDKQRRLGRALGYILAVAVIVTLGLLTFGRNCDYASEFSIWDATVRQCPDNHRAYNNRGNAYARKGDLDKAIADYDQAIRSKPKFAQAYHNRGNTYLNKGEVDKAIADYDQAIRSKPNFAEACNNLAFMLATHPEPQLRDGARAVRLAERACELGQYKVPAHVDTLAAAYAEVGQFDKAVETAQKAIQLVQTAKNEELAKDMQSRLELYKANRPHRESFSSKGASSLKPKKE
jgi:Tfp pilus assembly protein PilF